MSKYCRREINDYIVDIIREIGFVISGSDASEGIIRQGFRFLESYCLLVLRTVGYGLDLNMY